MLKPVHFQLIVFMLFACICCACALHYHYQNQRMHVVDVRIALPDAEAWMIEALPGVGPVARESILQSIRAGELVKWPKRSHVLAEQLFVAVDQDSASKNASQER